MKSSLLLLLATIGYLSVTPAYANLAGIGMAVDIDVVNKIKDYAMPMVISTINSYDVGKISFDGGYVDDLKFNFQVKDLNSILVSFTGADNAIKMHA